MQKKNICFAKHRTNGAILNLIVKALEIEQKDDKYQKIYQRFIKEESISVDEFNDTLNTVIEDILYNFFDNRDASDYNFTHNYIKELLSYYSKYKLFNETLVTSQKQLDFLTLINIFIPLFKLSIKNKQINIIMEILPDSTQTSFQKLFFIIEKSFTDKETINKKIYALLDKRMIAYDSISKNITNWLNGKTVPNIDNVKILVNLHKHTEKKFTKKKLNCYFKIAKIFDYLYKKSISYFGEEKTYRLIDYFKIPNISKNDIATVQFLKEKALHPDRYINEESKIINNLIKTNRKDTDAPYKLNEQGVPDIDFYNYSSDLGKLFELTHPKNKKKDDDETLYKNLQKKFKNKYSIDNNPYFQFIEARYFAQNREYKKSNKCYLSALQNGKNIMGESFKSVCIEGLIVSSLITREKKVDLINAKTDFTKFYKEAYFHGLLKEQAQEKSEYFLNDMKKQFDIYFKNLYAGIKQGNTNIITPNMTTSSEKIKIDYNNPNKLIKKGLPNPITQLMYCAKIGDYKSTEKLINAGADVNILKESDNASALIYAMPSRLLAKINPNTIKIIKLLIPKMSQTALNTQLIKKRETALSYAIEAGLVDIVKLLIKNDVDINQKVTLDEVTPLYYSITCIHRAGKGIPNKETIMNSKFVITDPLKSQKELKKLAKANNFSSSIFDEDRLRDTLMLHNTTNTMYKSIDNELKKLFEQNYKKNYNNYYAIFNVILENTKNVDIPNGASKHTPLIFATEINNEQIVRKLLDRGANPDRNIFTTQKELVRAYDYAEINKNKILMDLLE
jgi:ankyrin repeat protein